MYLEDESSPTISLDGEWGFRLAGSRERSVHVPAAWETYSADKLTDGPGAYRRRVRIPESWSGARVLLEAGAISYHATLRVNGAEAGSHRGMWSPVQWDITPFIRPGENDIEIEVWKPGARYPVRESLAGFLSDVATTFGGIWQGIRLRSLRGAAFGDLRVRAASAGRVTVSGTVAPLESGSPDSPVHVRLLGPDETPLALAVADTGERGAFAVGMHAPGVTDWSPGGPHLYRLEAALRSPSGPIARVSRRIGFRQISASGADLRLNDGLLHIRGVLDWGWDARRICPSPPREAVVAQFDKARALGFNLVKLCLFVPDDVTFDVADETGMLLWLEMPMWLPRVTPEFRQLALAEYDAIFRRLHHHPSIAILSLGCELGPQVDAGLLGDLSRLARNYFPNLVQCDNSGSAEAYGGVATPLADFYDYHFYTDPHFFQALVEHFDRASRPLKPWIYGEFCDADTLRDFSRLDPASWWLTEPVTLDTPDFLRMREFSERLAAAGIADGGAALTRIARRQATDIRKFIVERVRAKDASGGYVITGWIDTPIATSGVVDDLGELKFDPDEWRRFNADRVLLVDRERRRRWVGGDRPACKDAFTWRQGEVAEIHLSLSNGSGEVRDARLTWRMARADGEAVAEGSAEIGAVGAGQVAEIAVLNLRLPESSDGIPIELGLEARLEAETAIENSWRIWAVPSPRLPPVVSTVGGLLHRHSFHRIDRETQFVAATDVHVDVGIPILADEIGESLLGLVRAGGRALVWLRSPDARFTRLLPFWREAIHVFEPHRIWEFVPHAEAADMRFFSVATDFALDWPGLRDLLPGPAGRTFVWRRFDARAMEWADYLLEVELGRGRMLVTTLRFEGGLGRQPNTFEDNPMGAWMLASLLRLLGV